MFVDCAFMLIVAVVLRQNDLTFRDVTTKFVQVPLCDIIIVYSTNALTIIICTTMTTVDRPANTSTSLKH